ncbi:MAG: hypothetical protein R6U19_03270 [Bacteroidales bacterium]
MRITDELVPPPFRLNGLKHHLILVKQYLPPMMQMEQQDFLRFLNKAGQSITDFYYGCLTAEQVCKELKRKLTGLKAFEKASYRNWLWEQGGYCSLYISDGSHWIMREGIDTQRYIHIHPAKYSMHSRRIKARSIRIALAVLYYSNNPQQYYSPVHINIIRTEKLNLPPVKTIPPVHYWLIEKITDP